MALLNRTPAEVAQKFAVHACTDITGFGLLGHLREMLTEGVCGARLSTGATPVIDGTRALAEQEHVPAGTRRNLKSFEPDVRFDDGVSEIDKLVLSDAQTSGGLLFAVSPDQADELVNELRAVRPSCLPGGAGGLALGAGRRQC